MSGPECSVCAHPRRADIDRALAKDTNRAVARAFELAEATVRRHRPHLEAEKKPASSPPAPAPALELDDLEGRLRQLATVADKLTFDAQVGTLRERGAALGQARSTVESMAELQQKLTKGREVALLKSSQWETVKVALLEALRPHPQARADVLEAMRRLEAS